MNKKQNTENKDLTANFGNTMLCVDFISQEFKENLTHIYNQLGETIIKKGPVLSITRAYYVLVDLLSNTPLNNIEEYRLNHFHTFLWGYLLNNQNDYKSKKLFEIIDGRLAEICT